MSKKIRDTPNINSSILKNAIIGGAGLTIPSEELVPEGMGAVILFVPEKELAGKGPVEIQKNIGLPWSADGEGVWFDGLINNKKL